MNGNYDKWVIANHAPCYGIDYNVAVKDCQFDIIERIGNSSTSGLIYKIKANEYIFALKIMPILDVYNIEDNTREIRIAEMGSDLVKKGICPYFVQVVGYGYCTDFIFPEEAETFYRFSREYQQSLGNNETTPVNYLISELGIMDLKSWIKQNGDLMLPQFINDVLEAIICLQNIGIVHSDLHIENVLVMDRGKLCRLMAAIHDYGRSNTIISTYQYKLDYLTLLQSLLDHIPKGQLKEIIMMMHFNILDDWNFIKDKKDFMSYVVSKYGSYLLN